MRKKLHGIYVVEFVNGFKIGMASDIVNRMGVYKSPWCKPIISIYYIECGNPKMAEQYMKQQFKDYIITNSGSTEFITNVTLNEILNEMIQAKRKRPKWFSNGKYKNSKLTELIFE